MDNGLRNSIKIWIIVIITQPYSRGVGTTWMVIGLIVYCLYRWKSRLPLTHLPKKPGEKGIVDSTTEDYNTKHPL